VARQTLGGKASGQDDVINVDKRVALVVVIFTRCLAVDPEHDAVFCARGEVLRVKETDIFSVRWLHGTTSTFIVVGCGIHVIDNEGSAVAE